MTTATTSPVAAEPLMLDWLLPDFDATLIEHRVVDGDPESVYLHPQTGLPVARFEPGRVLALEHWGAFVLEPLGDERTRLIARGRTPRGGPSIFNALLMEIPHFVMERKMLLEIKRRAERSHTATVRRAAQVELVKTALHA